jgi:DnaJ family protein C protein 9
MRFDRKYFFHFVVVTLEIFINCQIWWLESKLPENILKTSISLWLKQKIQILKHFFYSVKKAYHKLALKVHPDKSDDTLKDENTKKFQVLGKIYSVLSDEEKRKVYDETGCIDGESSMFSENQNWESYWRTLFKKITEEDVASFFKTYKDSDKEKEDLLSAYSKFKGDMNKILESVMSVCCLDDEDRFRTIIQAAIDNNEVEAFRAFTNESETKRKKRQNNYRKEAEEVEKLKENLNTENDLAKMIGLKNEKRKQQSDDFFKSLEEKYAPKKKPTNKKKPNN